jgi:lipoprotein-anchoring transpeptidase ErfK/SrfK
MEMRAKTRVTGSRVVESRVTKSRVDSRTSSRVAAAIALLVTAANAAAAEERTTPTSPRAERRVVVSIPDCKLALIENNRVVRVYAVAVGADVSPSPVGTFRIVNRLTNPAYYRRGKVIPAGASNPLGTRWMGLDVKGFGIHGTDEPASIGHRRSHGCIRMLNRDVEELFERLRPGDVVELRGEKTSELDALFVG